MKQYLLCLIVFFSTINLLAQPIINSFSPVDGPVRKGVTISGSGFSTSPSANVVYFGPVRANVTSATASSLTVQVPAGAAYQRITVTSNNLTAYSARPFNVSFSGGILHSKSFSYGGRADSLPDNQTSDFELGDFDGDGLIDVAAIDQVSNILSIYRNTGSGETFSAASKIDYPTGSGPARLALGDIDGDGKLDIAVSNQKSDNVSIYKNTSSSGNVSFASKIDFNTGTQPQGLAFDDLDGDGKPDLAVACLGLQGTASILRNTSSAGIISFAAKFDLAVGGVIDDVVIYNLDNDTKPDMVFKDFGTARILIVKNNSSPGNFSFTGGITQATGTSPSHMAVGDLDADGKPDIAVTNFYSSTISVYKNTSAGTAISFTSKVDYPGGDSPDGIAIADVDGDNKPDLAVTNAFKGIEVFKNNSSVGAISFLAMQSYASGIASGKMLVGDINNDGKPDLAMQGGIFRVLFLKNDAAKPAITSFTPAIAGQGTTVTISGFKLDGASSVKFGGVPAASYNVVDSLTITAVVGTGASGSIEVMTPRGTAASENFTFGSPPTITSFTPVSGRAGTSVTITGTNLQNATGVSFGGVPVQSFRINSTTEIIAIVGAGQSGSVSVASPGGTASLAGFTYTGPIISSVSPISGTIGDMVTIQGFNFTETASVNFGGTTAASYTVINANTIQAQIGPGSTGNVTVATPVGVAVKTGFTYTGPTVFNSFMPTVAGPRTTITISGINLGTVTGVNFGGTPAASFKIISATTIEAVVGTGTSGSVSLSTSSGPISMAGFVYTPPPTITSYTPTSGPVGTIVTIQGSNFDPVPTNNIVYTGMAKAQVLSAASSRLTIRVPAATHLAPVSVTTSNLTATSEKPFTITFPGADSAFNDTSYTAKLDIPASGATESSFYDLDGDGKSDLIEVKRQEYTFSVAVNTSNNGNISFGPKLNFSSGHSFNPPYVEVMPRDMDGDGKPDLIVKFTDADYFGVSIYVYKNLSTPGVLSFDAGTNYINTSPQTISGNVIVLVNDLNEDGKNDLIIGDNSISPFQLSYYQNTTINGVITFAPKVNLYTEESLRNNSTVAIADFDGDNKPDIVTITDGYLAFRKNTTANGMVSFAEKIESYTGEEGIQSIQVTDLDGDNKPDLLTAGYSPKRFAVFRNLSSPGNFVVSTPATYYVSSGIFNVSIADLDGDNRPDVGVWADFSRFTLFKNKSTTGTILFGGSKEYSTEDFINSFCFADLDNDGKREIIMGYMSEKVTTILKNRIGLYINTPFCSGTKGALTADLIGTSYQWQMNTGNGFTNLTPGTGYSGINDSVLQLSSISSSWNGYQYRCIVDNIPGSIYVVSITTYVALSGDASSPARACVGSPYSISFTSLATPNGFTIQLWESTDSNAFNAGSSQTYNGTGLTFSDTENSSATKRYFFLMIPPAGYACAAPKNSDTTVTIIDQLTKPAISQDSNTLSVISPDAEATYQWQKQEAGGNWNHLDPPVIALSYTVVTPGVYRVQGDKGACTQYSAEKPVAINNSGSNPSAENVLLYPNPTNGTFTLDLLDLSGNWEMLYIVSAQSGQTVASFNIVNRTKIPMHLEALAKGVYLAVFRRSDGYSVSKSFIKM